MDPKSNSFARGQLKSMLFRLGLPILAVWLLGGFVSGLSHTPWVKGVALGIPAILTALAVGLVTFALRQARKAKAVAGLVTNVDSAEDRKAALEKLNHDYKKKDTAAIFARAQLELQEDPKRALATLEQIDLSRVMANVADEARAQRAMIHLLLGQVAPAKTLADGIELKRHEDPRSRGLMVSVLAETWARSGQSQRALSTLALLDAEDAAFEQIRPQLWRAQAYAAVHNNDVRGMRRALRRLADQDPRLLAGFLGKMTHPLLTKEAKQMLARSGAIERRVVVQRRP